MPIIRRLVDQRPTYGYRRIAALLNRERRAADKPVVNAKRVHRIMGNHAMLLEKHTAVRKGRIHDGKVMVMRSNLRWCSDGLEFTCWNGEVILEVGSQDVSMHDLVAIIGAEIGKPVAYRAIDIRREEVKTVFLGRFGTPERWQDDVLTADAMNSGLVTFHGQHEGRPHLPTTMEAFIRNVWKPSYHANAAPLEDEPETFALWCAKD